MWTFLGRFPRETLILACLFAGTGALIGCSERGEQKPVQGASTQTEDHAAAPKETSEVTPAKIPSEPEPLATQPAATQPASTYDSKPPYPVQLYVRSPEDEQPGWLKVLELADEKQPAAVKGSFPEQNIMIVETQNVRRIQIHVGHLPLAAGRRITLRIDKQGIEILRKGREFVVLKRSLTGEWVIEPTAKD